MKKKIALISIIIVVLFCLFSTLFGIISYNNVKNQKDRYNYIARNETVHMGAMFDSVMSRITTLKLMVQENNGETMFFAPIAGEIYDSIKNETMIEVKNIALAKDGIVNEVYPLVGNENFVGFNYFDTTIDGNIENKEAYEEGNIVLTNPYELEDGEVVISGRAPVFIESDGDKVFWGLVSVTIDYNSFMEVLHLSNIGSLGINYELAYVENGIRTVMEKRNTVLNDAIEIDFKMNNLNWILSVSPENGWMPVSRIVFSLFFLLILSVLIGLMFHMHFKLRDKNKMLQEISVIDKLTGSLNRRAYEYKLDELNEKGIPDNFIYIAADINGLKQVNDNLGHAAGDELLCGANECLNMVFNKYCTIYRIGGDEFACMIIASADNLTKLKHKLSETINSWQGEMVNSLSVSFGYVLKKELPDEHIVELVKLADKRMYDDKKSHYESIEK